MIALDFAERHLAWHDRLEPPVDPETATDAAT